MSNPVPIPAEKPRQMVTRKSLRQTANRVIDGLSGHFSETEIYNAIIKEAETANIKTLLQETAWSITRSVVDKRATPRLSGNEDWVGYGDMLIKLDDGLLVKVQDANKANLAIRLRHVVENLQKITQAANAEVDRIKKITELMDRYNLKTAGEAIQILMQG